MNGNATIHPSALLALLHCFTEVNPENAATKGKEAFPWWSEGLLAPSPCTDLTGNIGDAPNIGLP